MWYDPGTNMLIYDEPKSREVLKHAEDGVYLDGGIVGMPLTYLIVRWPAPTAFLLFLSSIVTMIILLNEGFTRKYTKK